MQLKPNQLYVCHVLPDHWVATDDDGQAWILPARCGGWDDRSRYVGLPDALVDVPNYNAVGTGWRQSAC